MANITNPQAVAYCNGTIRPLFDKLMKTYNAIVLAEQQFTAQGLGVLIPSDGAAIVVDGSAIDGRPPISGADVNILLANAQTIANLFTANSNLVLNQTLKGSVNPQ